MCVCGCVLLDHPVNMNCSHSPGAQGDVAAKQEGLEALFGFHRGQNGERRRLLRSPGQTRTDIFIWYY